MKTIAKVILAAMFAFVLVGCDDQGAKELDMSNNAYIKGEVDKVVDEMQGETLGPIIMAERMKVAVVRLTPEIASVVVAFKNKTDTVPQVISFVCVTDAQVAGITHNVYNDGKLVRGAEHFSIVRYPANATKYTERGDVVGLKFSTSDGDNDIFAALKKMTTAKDTDILSFSLDGIRNVDAEHYESIGHSYAFTGKEWKEATKGLNWAACEGSTIDATEEFIEATTNEEVMDSYRQMKAAQ